MSARYGHRVRVRFGVLGPVTAWDDGTGEPIALRGPRHRAVLARLIVARGRTVPVGHLVDDLWVAPPDGAVAAVRTFVAALRRALEPDRPPRSPARLLVTAGPGYALRAAEDTVDAWLFEHEVTGDRGTDGLMSALALWRGPAYADFAGAPWARAERGRLAELRLHAVELLAGARLAAGRPAEAVPDLDAHVSEHPWREDGWRLLALALYRAGRQADALGVLRRARRLLAEQLGVDPGPALRRLENDILRQAEVLAPGPLPPPGQVWAEVTADYDRIVGASARARLDSTVGMLRDLAVTGGGGLVAARRHRLGAIAAAGELGDPELTARVIGAYDVPAIWTRSDDPEQAAAVVAAAERALATGAGTPAGRARLLATIAVETRGVASGRAAGAAREAERIARELDDPALLVFALNGVFLQSFHRTGMAAARDGIGAEIIGLAQRHGLITAEVLGRLIRLQSRAALADFGGAAEQAAAADRLADRHELPLVGVFTDGFRAMRAVAEGGTPDYHVLEGRLAAMPGLEHGLRALAELSVRLRDGLPAQADGDFGPYEPWARPLVLLARGRRGEAAADLRDAPAPPPDQLTEAMWTLLARAARELDDRDALARSADALAPAAGELAGGASGLVTFGPVQASPVYAP